MLREAESLAQGHTAEPQHCSVLLHGCISMAAKASLKSWEESTQVPSSQQGRNESSPRGDGQVEVVRQGQVTFGCFREVLRDHCLSVPQTWAPWRRYCISQHSLFYS